MKTPKTTTQALEAYVLSAIFAFVIVCGHSLAVFADDPPAGEEPEIVFPYEDEVLLGFYDANRELSTLQRETQENIQAVIEEHGLTPERFSQIGNAARIGALDGGAFSAEEIDAFNTVAPKVTAIQREMQGMLQAVIGEQGLTTTQYQEILTEFRSNKDLQEYVLGLARERAMDAAREERRLQREAEAAAEEEKEQ